jgi:hypothetical protein
MLLTQTLLKILIIELKIKPVKISYITFADYLFSICLC